MPLIRDPGQRASLYPQGGAAAEGAAEGAGRRQDAGKASWAATSASSCPARRRTLTLAEVEVYSDGRNVARQGKATQKNTAYGGEAEPGHRRQHQRHLSATAARRTRGENTAEPWWEVDLGQSTPSTRSSIYNRTDGDLGRRLNGFTLQVLDNAHRIVFQHPAARAPAEHATFAVGGSSPERQRPPGRDDQP